MIDLELRRKALEANGWTHVEYCRHPHELIGIAPHGVFAVQCSGVLAHLPAVESDPGVAINLLIEYSNKHDLQWSLDKDTEHVGNVTCLLYAIEVVRDIHAETCSTEPATAICQAIVEAHKAIAESAKEKP